jgi:hypothetical protein
LQVPDAARGAIPDGLAYQVRYELHLEGCRGPVLHTVDRVPGNTLPSPPRVVIYGDKVWQFYRFCQPKVPEHRAAWYKRVEPLHLAPGEYKP